MEAVVGSGSASQVEALPLVQVEVPVLVSVLAQVPRLSQVEVLAPVLVLVLAPLLPSVAVGAVFLLLLAYMSSVFFCKRWKAGDNHTTGRPNPRFFPSADHNWGTFALKHLLTKVYTRNVVCQCSDDED